MRAMGRIGLGNPGARTARQAVNKVAGMPVEQSHRWHAFREVKGACLRRDCTTRQGMPAQEIELGAAGAEAPALCNRVHAFTARFSVETRIPPLGATGHPRGMRLHTMAARAANECEGLKWMAVVHLLALDLASQRCECMPNQASRSQKCTGGKDDGQHHAAFGKAGSINGRPCGCHGHSGSGKRTQLMSGRRASQVTFPSSARSTSGQHSCGIPRLRQLLIT